MTKVELIFDKDCPHISMTRSNLMKAFSLVDLPAYWKEWDRNSSETPQYAKKHGSPTILVDNEDLVSVKPESEANCCRFYEGSGVPSVDLITKKLLQTKNESSKNSTRLFGFLGTISVGPGFGAAFLAKASCPFCYPAIAGFLSSVGLGFLLKGAYLYAVMVTFLGITLFGLGFKAKKRRGFKPLYLGAFGSLLVLVFHYFKNDYLFYLGIGILIIASIWNIIPVKEKQCSSCN